MLICLEILININKQEWDKAYGNLDKIFDVIVDMSKNKEEEHFKAMRYINKIS